MCLYVNEVVFIHDSLSHSMSVSQSLATHIHTKQHKSQPIHFQCLNIVMRFPLLFSLFHHSITLFRYSCSFRTLNILLFYSPCNGETWLIFIDKVKRNRRGKCQWKKFIYRVYIKMRRNASEANENVFVSGYEAATNIIAVTIVGSLWEAPIGCWQNDIFLFRTQFSASLFILFCVELALFFAFHRERQTYCICTQSNNKKRQEKNLNSFRFTSIGICRWRPYLIRQRRTNSWLQLELIYHLGCFQIPINCYHFFQFYNIILYNYFCCSTNGLCWCMVYLLLFNFLHNNKWPNYGKYTVSTHNLQ